MAVGRPRQKIVESEGVDLHARASEVGMDLEAVLIADNEQGRVFKVLAIAQKLAIGGSEVFVFSFVLPAEEAALPDVGEAFAVIDGRDGLLEQEAFADLVCGGGMRLAENVAQIDEMALRTLALREFAGFPALDEFD